MDKMILDRIVEDKQEELEAAKRATPLDEIRKKALAAVPALDFAAALRGDTIRIIAEVKKASPSKGLIRADFHPAEIAGIYAENGASAISILTEVKYFQGSLDYLKEIRQKLAHKKIPLLRKDFLTDPYQVYEARAYGADAILLIAAILSAEKLQVLLHLSRSMGMRCLVEVHNEAELQTTLESGAEIIGINNRDLRTFVTDLAVTERLRPLIPQGKTVVSESGIKDRRDIERLAKLGINAVLVGESLMASADIGAKLRELL